MIFLPGRRRSGGNPDCMRLNFAMPESAPTECDLVVHASATAGGLATALNLARDEGIVLELSRYGAGDVIHGFFGGEAVRR
jgi:hypothetical protein